MDKKTAWHRIIRSRGYNAVLYTYSGDPCPCLQERGAYSPEWHRRHPEPDDEDCHGTTIINVTETITNVKILLHSIGTITVQSMFTKEVLTAIGEYNRDDIMIYGMINSSTGAAIDLTTLNENYDKIIWRSKSYVIRHVFENGIDAPIVDIALAKRIA